MPIHAITGFLVFSLINAFTPGPGNILALDTATNCGYRRGRPLFLGIFAGYYVVQLLCAAFVFGLGSFLPGVLGVVKYLGAAYILYLAIHIAVGKPPDEGALVSVSFLKGFLLQFVNVKIYLFGITALTGYVTDYSTSFWVLCGFELVIATIGTIATMTWVGMRLLIQAWYRKHFRVVNIVLALTLLECVVNILLS